MGQGGAQQRGIVQNALGDLDGVAALSVDAAAQAALGPGIDRRLGVDVLGQGDAQGAQLPGQGGEGGRSAPAGSRVVPLAVLPQAPEDAKSHSQHGQEHPEL